jgi:hypothetical protein
MDPASSTSWLFGAIDSEPIAQARKLLFYLASLLIQLSVNIGTERQQGVNAHYVQIGGWHRTLLIFQSVTIIAAKTKKCNRVLEVLW